jgi:threonine/homoserine/homoserine lactone efflux protein
MMPLEQLLALVTLAIAGSFTPGPNNTIATVTGANHGLRAVVPHLLGVPFGFSTMLIAGSLGAAALIAANPWLVALLKWGGVAYLLLIAWQMSRATISTARGPALPLTFWQSAVFQYVNPKAWMIAVATVGTFAEGGHAWPRTLLICAAFSACAVASLALWAWVGVSLRSWLAVGRRLSAFNATMGALLAATALWMAFQ